MSHTGTVRGTLIRSEVSAQRNSGVHATRVVRSQNEDAVLMGTRGP